MQPLTPLPERERARASPWGRLSHSCPGTRWASCGCASTGPRVRRVLQRYDAQPTASPSARRLDLVLSRPRPRCDDAANFAGGSRVDRPAHRARAFPRRTQGACARDGGSFARFFRGSRHRCSSLRGWSNVYSHPGMTIGRSPTPDIFSRVTGSSGLCWSSPD